MFARAIARGRGFPGTGSRGRHLKRLAVVTLAIGLVGALVGPLDVASADLPVGSDQDTTGPQIAAFSFAPNSVDVRSTDAQISGTAHLTDDLSGVDDVSISYQSPSGFQSTSFRFTSSDRASGT